jgi:asparagine N-glycosylation enzyme membrane subunit Stt3
MDSPQEQNGRVRRNRHHGFSAIFAGLFLIMLGGLLFLASQGIISWDKWWQLFLIGLGVILLIDVFIRYLQDRSIGFQAGRVIAGLVLIIIGTAFFLSAVNWWALIIVAVGVVILIVGVWRRSVDK